MPRRTWNYRVVRRHATGEVPRTWLEIAEVHYRNGEPSAYAVDLRVPFGADECATNAETFDDFTALASLRWSLDKMRAALDLPVLDEIKDLGPRAPNAKSRSKLELPLAQIRVLRTIVRHIETNGAFPTVAALCECLGLNYNSVADSMYSLCARGLMSRDGTDKRGRIVWSVTTKGLEFATSQDA